MVEFYVMVQLVFERRCQCQPSGFVFTKRHKRCYQQVQGVSSPLICHGCEVSPPQKLQRSIQCFVPDWGSNQLAEGMHLPGPINDTV